MTTTTLKKELHHAIDTMPDAGFLKAVYAMFKEYPVSYDSGYELSSEDKENLDHQRKLHKAGKTKSYTITEVRKMVLSKLKK
jgi:hypothetical protein